MTSLLNYKIFPAVNEELAKQHPPLLILHGLLGSMDNWRSQAMRLSLSRTVITADLRNHGRSPHLTGMSYKEMALDIVALAKHENLSQIDLLGHSMGGKVSMWLALNQPELIAKLIIVDITPKSYPLWHQTVLAALQQVPLATLRSRKAIDQHLAVSIPDDGERIFLSKNLQRNSEGGYEWRCNLSEISTSYLKIAAFPVSGLTFPNKAFFIGGANSNYILPEDHVLIKSIFKDVTIHSVPETGHLPHIEQADVFFELVSDFLN